MEALLIARPETYRITQTATRHERLQSLVGAAFYQVSHEMAEKMARAQFLEKTVNTNADEFEHLGDFENLWEGLELRWHDALTDHHLRTVERHASHNLSYRIERSHPPQNRQHHTHNSRLRRRRRGG